MTGPLDRPLRNTFAHHRGHAALYGGGYSSPLSLSSSTTSLSHTISTSAISSGTVVHTYGPISVTVSDFSSVTSWTPTTILPVRRSTHPFDEAWSSTALEIIVKYCQLQSDYVIAYITKYPKINITVRDLRNLINTMSMTNDDTMSIFLEIFCAHTGHAYLCPQFLPLLQTDKWAHVSTFFTIVTVDAHGKHLGHTLWGNRQSLSHVLSVTIIGSLSLEEKSMAGFTSCMLMILTKHRQLKPLNK